MTQKILKLQAHQNNTPTNTNNNNQLAPSVQNSLQAQLQATKDKLRRISRENNELKSKYSPFNSFPEFVNLSDQEKFNIFVTKNKVRKEHPNMTSACLDTMCTAYVLTKDRILRGQMRTTLYKIRKQGSLKEKRAMARMFQYVIRNHRGLRIFDSQNTLHYLGKIDTFLNRRTKVFSKTRE